MISLIVVNYRAAALAVDCIESARHSTHQPLEVIAVDNSVDAGEADRLRSHADAVATPTTNEGYAAGINVGRKLATGSVLLVCNPDVVFAPGTIDLLAAALDEKNSVAGPALFWDDEYRWLLPPADVTTTLQKLDEIAASRLRMWAAWRDRRRIKHRIRFWQTIETIPVRAISGAVMAIRAADFDRVHGFDETFRLYFEEIDFMRRVERTAGRTVYVPAARCRHIYNQSAAGDRDAAATLYAQSERTYLEKWSRPAAMLTRFARPEKAPTFRELAPNEPIEVDLDDALVEASPLPNFATAAGHFPPRGHLDVPVEIWDSYGADALYLRVIDCGTGSVRAAYVKRKARLESA